MALDEKELRNAAGSVAGVAHDLLHASTELRKGQEPIVSTALRIKRARDELLAIMQELSEDAAD